MYSIILKDGKTININATEIEYSAIDRTIQFIIRDQIVARINKDSVVGWINADYIIESQESEE